jgi:hypothetical protein
MQVTIYKNLSEVKNGFYRDVDFILNRIKEGSSKELIEQIRNSKSDVTELKKKLPAINFQGKFKERNDFGLELFSGLLILDFDGFDSFQSAKEFKSIIFQDEFVFSAFISPKGLGCKVLLKIPNQPENYKLYFDGANTYFDSENFDPKNGNISRLCFESYDPEILVRKDSKVFDIKEDPELEQVGVRESSIPIVSDSRIIDNLLKWWNGKYPMGKGSRNNNLFVLASAFNDFGINESECDRVLIQFQEKDFKASEIKTIIKSAYRKRENFGTRFFEDNETKEKIENLIRNGKTKKEIIEKIHELPKEKIEKAIDQFKDNKNINEFWDYDKNGNVKLLPHKFKFWLEQNNYLKYFPTDSKTFTFVHIDQNQVEETNEKRIKDFVLKNLLSRENVGFKPYDYMAASARFFTIDFLSMLDSANIEIKEDTKEECFLYYQNSVVRVTDSQVDLIDYFNVDGYVWKNRIIDREFKKADHHDSVFRKFIWLISGENISRYNTFKSVIGYLLHSFKTSANNKAIIFNDSVISENPNGGSGKGVFWNALSHLKKVSSIDGKTFDFNKSFAYQTVSTDCQLLVYDDVKKNFDFERLFSQITEGITIEYKGQDAIKLPINKSPKIIITTNYTVGGIGGSFERRKFEVELSAYFNSNRTPLQVFGHLLFDEWDSLEWSRFDNYMINCIQFYLQNGLIENDFDNIEVRKFIKNTSFEFYEWTKDHDVFGFNQRLSKKAMYEKMIQEYSDLKWVSQKRFKGWLEQYCKFYEFEYREGVDAIIGRYFEILNDQEIDFTPKEAEF